MSLRDGPLGDIRVPLTWSAAAALVIAAILAAALLFSHQRDPMKASAYDTARHVVDAVAAPVGGALAAPVRWTEGAVGYVGGYFFAVSENRRLTAELAKARSLGDVLAAEQLDNRRLRAVLGIRTDPPLPHVDAETISDSRGPFANSRVANAGGAEGVTEGNPVLSEHGLVGRIVGVSPHASRILLLTDAESRTPVILVRTNGRAILAGDGGGSPKLDYIRSADDIRVGDRVLTSGDGGVFPRGLPVGSVVKGFDGAWRVALDSDASPIDYVQILLFTDFAQLVDEKALAPKELPSAMTEEPNPSIAPLAPPTTGKAAPKAAKTSRPPAPASLAPPKAARAAIHRQAAASGPRPGREPAGPKSPSERVAPKAAPKPHAPPPSDSDVPI